MPSPSPAAADVAGRPALRGERYVLFGKIAEGGMAGIYRAWDAKLKGWRAVKVLLPEFAQRRRLRARFESEARAMAAIDHPNVVRVFDVVTDASLPYMVMEIADGGSLADWIEHHGAMPPRLALRCVAQIAKGLGAAHAVGVIHRDVKPQNVLLDLSGRCMVSDFGIARVEFLDSMTRTGTSMGTIGYMAPEQRSDAKVVDVRADVYALGALLYKLLTSVVLTDMFMIGLDAELIEPIPLPLRPMLVKACHHDRDDRYPDVASFAAELAAVEAQLPEDPSDTPPLANPLRETSLDTSSRVFASIASVLVAMPGSGRVSLETTMPMQLGAASSAWQEDTESDTVAREDRTREERAVTPSAEPTPTLERQPPVVAVRREGPGWLWAGVSSLLGVTIVLLGAFAFSLWTIRLAQRREVAARSALYAAIDADRPVLDLVSAKGSDPSAVAGLLARHASYGTTNREPARQEAADAFVTALLGATEPLDVSGHPAEVQLRNLALTQAEWHAARENLAETRASMPGIWAATLGF